MKQLFKDDYELAALSAIKSNPGLYDELLLVPEDFYSEKNRAAFQALSKIIESKKRPDNLTLLDAGVEASLIAKLDLPTESNAKWYAESLRVLRYKRDLRQMALQVQDKIEGGETWEKIMEDIEHALGKLKMPGARKIYHLAEFIEPTVAEIKRRYDSGLRSGISTSFDPLDEVTNGWQPGFLYILAARPSIGKTAMALSMAHSAALESTTGFFSCEMSKDQLANRLLAIETQINLQNLGSGLLPTGAMDKLNQAKISLSRLRLLVDDTPNPTLTHIKARSRQLKRYGAQLLFIDYLTLIRHGDPRIPRPERVGEICKEIKELARELELPIVLLSQLNREAEGREPGLECLRQSGEIEEDADVVIFLHRKREDSSGAARVIVAKNRQGATTNFDVVFWPQFATFADRPVDLRPVEENGQ